MTGKHWTVEDIPWAQFDPSRLDPNLVKVVKAASMVEFNGGDYAAYLCNVFPDDLEFQEAAKTWALEEVQHGRALGRWAEMADPTFDFERSFQRFRDGYKLPLDATVSVRGSRAGELVARCIVEVGTSSYYSALGAAAKEPVLKDVCRRIASDEFRHYKLFYTHLKRYVEIDRISKARRILVALSRINETEDDELAFAYYVANSSEDEVYDRKRWSRAYALRAFGYYRPMHIERGIAMAFKAAGLSPQSPLVRWVSRGAYWLLQSRHKRLAASV